jgi:hypothetical protein
MARILRSLVIVALGSLALSGVAQAAGGRYVFVGGTAKQQTQVRKALNVSSFDWSVVPAQIKVHIAAGFDNEATPGEIWLDSNVLNSGKFSWGIVQHEYAHQVDFFVLNDSQRAELGARLGGVSWWQSGSVSHEQLSSERFASTLAWSYWQSKANSLRPTSKSDESAAMAPAKFRSMLAATVLARIATG